MTAKEQSLLYNPFSDLMGAISVSSDSSFTGTIEHKGVCGVGSRDSMLDSVVMMMSP